MPSRDGWAALPRGAMGLSAVCECGIFDHTHLLFFKGRILSEITLRMLSRQHHT